MPGPPPKRSDQRRRTNKPAAGEPTTAPGADVVEIPDPSPSWHQAAAALYSSLKHSGQSAFYQPSDWAAAWLLAESISMELLSGEPPKGAAMSAWRQTMAALMVTEGDRRRLAVELQRPKPEEEASPRVSHLDDARARLRGAG